MKTTILSLGLLCCAAFASARAQESSDPEELHRAGRAALLRGDARAAVALLQRAVDADAAWEHVPWRLALARALQSAGEGALAEPLLRTVLERVSDHAEAGQLLAELLAARGDAAGVRAVLEPLLAFRKDYRMHHLLAEAAYALEDFDQAGRWYAEAVRLNPESAWDHYQLGNVHLGERRYARAAESYERSRELGLGGAVLHFKLASAWFNLRNYLGATSPIEVEAGAVGELRSGMYLIEPLPGRPNAFLGAPVRSAIHQVAMARAGGMQSSLDLDLLEAGIWLQSGRFARAHALLLATEEKVRPEDRALHCFHIAEASLALDREAEHLERLEQAARLDEKTYAPALVAGCVEVAERRSRAGDLVAAIGFLERAISLAPENASLHADLADLLAEVGRAPDAVAQWRLVLALEPEHPQRTRILNAIQRHSR
ncbi:MAG: tetratricopeptide repeat protein [Planctomycetes bacterium]|nr:tetratricopeptide repeat protein [Planctomycetota bacterium]